MSELQSATGSFQANFISRLSWGIKECGAIHIFLSFSKCCSLSKYAFIFKMREVLQMLFFLFLKKHNCKQKYVHSQQIAFTDEVVDEQQNIYKAFKFVSVVKNL